MRILLVLPAADGYRAMPGRVLRRRMLRFSVLPLTTVAALTPPQHEVILCDENVQPLDPSVKVDVVGISFMTGLAPRAYQIAELFRARGVTTVAGGYHPTLCPHDAAEHFDVVVRGDAEGQWPRVLSDIQAGCPARIYEAPRPCDLGAAPIPRRDLTRPTRRHYVTCDAVQVGRGCPHRCAYCSITAFHHHTYRARPMDSVLDELRTIGRNFMFVDDNIIADRDYARDLFTRMIPLRKRWVSQCSIRIADDPELLDLAARAGCRGLFIGIETLNAGNLAEVGKSFNDPSAYPRRIAAIRARGIGVQAGLIVGMDHDDPHVFGRLLRFLHYSQVDAIQLNIMTPLPGTPLYERMRAQGRIIDHDWSHYDFFHTVIQPARMSPEQLQQGAEWLYAQYYRLDRILWRSLLALPRLGLVTTLLNLRLNLTYRYDNRRLGIVGRNPAEETKTGRAAPSQSRLVKAKLGATGGWSRRLPSVARSDEPRP